MKLIIERIDGVTYAYRERDRHFKKVEPNRPTPRLDPALLDQECDLSAYSDFHMVFDIKK